MAAQSPQFNQIASTFLSHTILPGRTKNSVPIRSGPTRCLFFVIDVACLVKAAPQFVTEQYVLVGFIVLVIRNGECQLDLV